MTFQEFYKGLAPSEREAYAQRIPLSRRYIELHLLNTLRRNPRDTTKERMAKASNGALSYEQVCASFPQEAAAS